MEVIEIRHRVILDAMLDELRLPRSTSHTVTNRDGTVIVTVTFFPTTGSVHQTNGQCSCESNPRSSIRDAENEAVHDAIKYMECVERKTPKDYNYFRLQRKNEAEAFLHQEMTKKDREIERLTEKVLTRYLVSPTPKYTYLFRYVSFFQVRLLRFTC